MRTKNFLAFVALLFIVIETNAQIKIISNGNVGIGVSSPTYKLQTEGPLCFGYYGASSSWEKIILDWNSYSYGNPTLYCNTDGQLL